MSNVKQSAYDQSNSDLSKTNNRDRFRTIISKLNEGLYEREEIIAKTVLASISGESIFYLGPPGVAKSLISRRLKYIYKDCTNFEYLMNRFSTPEEIFGPLSVAKLRDEDKLERKVAHYLPGAEIAFLDEIWKAGPSIQNTLLTIINEKIFRNGSQIIDVPLITLIAASNELPSRDQGLEALWDRFIIRLKVNNVKNYTSFSNIINSASSNSTIEFPKELQISKDEYDFFQNRIKKVVLPDSITQILFHLRELIEEYNLKITSKEEQLDEFIPIYVSDRRWKKISHILKTSAMMNGRENVDVTDCFLLYDMIWDSEEQIQVVRTLVNKALLSLFSDYTDQLALFEDILQEFSKTIQSKFKNSNQINSSNLVSVQDEYNIYHFRIKFVGDKIKYPELKNIEFCYNWHDKFTRNWVPKEGDVLGLCNTDLNHHETVKILSVTNDNNKISFSVNYGNQEFEFSQKNELKVDKEGNEDLLREITAQLKEVGNQLSELEVTIEMNPTVDSLVSQNNIFCTNNDYLVLSKVIENIESEIIRVKLLQEEVLIDLRELD